MELVDYSSSIYSIIPALLAIILAIATRRVLVSLKYRDYCRRINVG